MGIFLKIKEERNRNKLTQRELAEKIDVSTRTIASWENEKDDTTPSLDNVKKLSTVFGVSLDYLLKDSIEQKSRYEAYAKLGKDILEITGEAHPQDFIEKYFICCKETSILFPKIIAEAFLEEVSNELTLMEPNNRRNDENIQKLHTKIEQFIYFWYKYNKGKYELSKIVRVRLLKLFSRSFSEEAIISQLHDPEIQEDPLLLLRKLIADEIFNTANLKRHKNKGANLYEI